MTSEDLSEKYYQNQQQAENVDKPAVNNSNYNPNNVTKVSIWKIIKTALTIMLLFCVGVLILGPLFIAALIVIGTVIGMLYLLILLITLTNPDSDLSKDKDANDG